MSFMSAAPVARARAAIYSRPLPSSRHPGTRPIRPIFLPRPQRLPECQSPKMPRKLFLLYYYSTGKVGAQILSLSKEFTFFQFHVLGFGFGRQQANRFVVEGTVEKKLWRPPAINSTAAAPPFCGKTPRRLKPRSPPPPPPQKHRSLTHTRAHTPGKCDAHDRPTDPRPTGCLLACAASPRGADLGHENQGRNRAT